METDLRGKTEKKSLAIASFYRGVFTSTKNVSKERLSRRSAKWSKACSHSLIDRELTGIGGSGYSLHRCALGLNPTEFSDGTCASSTAPDRKRDEQEIKNNKDSDICLAADAEAVAMQTFTQNKVHAVPRH